MQKRIENRVTLGLRFPSFRRAEIRPPFVDREGTESPPREVIKLGGASESPNLSRYTLDPGWRGLRFRYSEFQGFGRRIQPFLASSLVAVIRRVSLEPFHDSRACVHHSVHVSFLRSVLSCSFLSVTSSLRSIENSSSLQRGREGFLLRVSLDKYFLPFAFTNRDEQYSIRFSRNFLSER